MTLKRLSACSQGGRYFYAVFLCHLAVEKALKGCYYERLGKVPPKVHNLVYLLTEMEMRPLSDVGRFMVRLNEANITTRYPKSLEKVTAAYTEDASCAEIHECAFGPQCPRGTAPPRPQSAELLNQKRALNRFSRQDAKPPRSPKRAVLTSKLPLRLGVFARASPCSPKD